MHTGQLGPYIFHGLAASSRGRLFRDSEFAEISCADNGREGVASSLLWWQTLALFDAGKKDSRIALPAMANRYLSPAGTGSFTTECTVSEPVSNWGWNPGSRKLVRMRTCCASS